MKPVTQWLSDVVAHYGSLDAFSDAASVRAMRRIVVHEVSEHERIVREITDPNSRAYYINELGLDYEVSKSQLETLDDWLARRGLTP